jgi:bacterioferritin-associated ferredoxin
MGWNISSGLHMYVCLCNGITDRTIRQAAAEGICSLSELKRRTGCAEVCGCCAEAAEQVLHEALGRQPFSLSLAAA